MEGGLDDGLGKVKIRGSELWIRKMLPLSFDKDKRWAWTYNHVPVAALFDCCFYIKLQTKTTSR